MVVCESHELNFHLMTWAITGKVSERIAQLLNWSAVRGIVLQCVSSPVHACL